MSSKKFLAIVILVCAASAVLAKPSILPFDKAIDQTICKTKVEYDINEKRIPKVIKMIKCEDDPYVMCPTSDGKAPCCGAVSLVGAPKFSCTEVQDVVLVKNVEDMSKHYYTVSIGCSCIKQTPDKASLV